MSHPKIYWSFVFIATLALAAISVSAQSPGSLDPTFGSGGKVVMQVYNSIPTYAEGMAAQLDGKIVAVVGFATENLLRLNPDGSPDLTFGNAGRVTFSWSNSDGNGNVLALAIQTVGGQERIVVAGYSPLRLGRSVVGALHVERFMSDGSVDTSFGTNGHAVINTGYADAIAIQPDGKILTVGGDGGKLVRLTVNGTLDSTFGAGGVVSAGGKALAVDSAGGVLVGGGATVGKGNKSRGIMTVKRFNPDGSLDSAFGTSGTASADFGVSAQVWSLAVDPFGNILAGGTASGPAVVRFTANGLPDTSLNGTGRVLFAGLPGAGRGMVVQADGKIVMSGTTNSDLGLVRFNHDGSLDTAFGSGGSVVVDISGNDLSDFSVLQADPGCACPKIVLAGGSAPNTTFSRFVVF